MPFNEKCFKPLTKSVLVSLRLAVASVTHTAICKKMFGSGIVTLVISDEEMNMLFLICYFVH